MLAIVDSYTVVKFFHVFGAVVWIGGAIMITIFAELTRRVNDPGAVVIGQ